MKNKGTKFFTENLLLKLLGLFLGFLLWLVLSNAQDPVITRSLSVSINYDESWLDANNYKAISKPSSVIITYEVRKSNASKVRTDDFTASVDLSNYLGGQINPAPEATTFIVDIEKRGAATYIEDWDYPKAQGRYVDVVVDTIKSEYYDVEIVTQGEMPDGYEVNTLYATPQRVVVTGPTSYFSTVASVKATVDMTQIVDENSTVQAPLHICDGNNRVITNSGLVLGVDSVSVAVGLRSSKTVAISVDSYSGEAAEGYACSSFNYAPKEVKVVGSKAALAKISTIQISKKEMDITGATENMEFVVPIEDYLSPDLTLAEGEPKEVVITCEIGKMEERTFLIEPKFFQFMWANENYTYEILNEYVEITLRALPEELDAFIETAGHLQGWINVSESMPSETSQYFGVRISIDEQYEVLNDIIVEVKITDKNAGETAEEQPLETEAEETETTAAAEEEETVQTTSAAEPTQMPATTPVPTTAPGTAGNPESSSGAETTVDPDTASHPETGGETPSVSGME